jgi:hypothetical protein
MTTARQDIGGMIAGTGWADVDPSPRLGRIAGQVADGILAKHARELADLIRPKGNAPRCCDDCYRVWEALSEAADTIEGKA